MTKWMKRIIRSGDVVEVTVFPVGNNARPRGRRKGEYTPRKQDANDRLAIRRLARTLHCNFSPGDYLLTLEHKSETPLAEAREAAREYIRKLCAEAKKLGIVVKWIRVTSDIDPRTGENVSSRTGEVINPHTHIIISHLPETLIHGLWQYGGVDIRHLRDQGDYTAVATYFIKQCRRDVGAKGYSTSRNMTKPVIISEEFVPAPSAEIKVPRGAVVSERTAFDASTMTPQYVRYVVPKKQPPRKRATVRLTE